MKKVLIVVLAVILIGGGIFYWKKNDTSNKKKKDSNSLVAVTSGPIERTVDSTGEVTPLNRVEIKPPIPGRVERLLVDEGSKVTSGEILAWMSSSDRAAILDAARAKGIGEFKKWEDAYKPTPILAPLTGVIILKNVVVGQTVDASTVLYAMSDRLIVTAQVDESDIGRVKLNMPARITLDSYPNDPIQGHVFQILYEGKNTSSVITYDVKITPENVPPFFRSQMTANISLIAEHRDNAVVIPTVAVRETSDGKLVMVPGPDGKPAPRSIETGIESGENIEVTSGLQAGDTVIVSRMRYTPQKGPQSSPLTMGGRPNSGQQGQGGGSGQQRQRN